MQEDTLPADGIAASILIIRGCRVLLDETLARLAELQHGQGELRNGQSDLRQGQAELRSDLNELKLHMSVLHEDAISRIAAIPEYTGPTKAEFAELKEMIGRRLDPLEATVRHHSAEIEQLKETRG